MTLSKAEIDGPWMFVLECGHNSGFNARKVDKKRHCVACGTLQVVTFAHYSSKKAIPIADLIEARQQRHQAKQVKKKERNRQTDAALNAIFGPPRPQHHRSYRAQLIAEGCSVELADKATMEYRWAGLRERAGAERYRRVRDRLDAPQRLSDARYKPARIDPLLQGPLRATGQTAAAVKRGTTITDWQYRERK